MKVEKVNFKIKIAGFVLMGGVLGIALFFFFTKALTAENSFSFASLREVLTEEEKVVVPHIKTPQHVKAIYMTACAANTPYFRKSLENLINETEINSVVLNIKDETGKIAFDVDNPLFEGAIARLSNGECKITDIKKMLEDWHSMGIYVIGRLPVFQDPYLVKTHPELAVKREKDGAVWKDHKGISWLDAGAKETWDYIIDLAKEVYWLGFDEINFDYIRFPSDGNMNEIYYPASNERLSLGIEKGKAKILQEFFVYLNNQMKKEGIPTSADLFGMVTTNEDDLNIGQILEYALPFFDYICPMVYPSHYPSGFIGLSNPAEHPYKVIHYSMEKAVARTISAGFDPLKLRPWIQDFDLGADYDAQKVRTQIQATYDVGLNSWLLWSASNRYTREALLGN